MQFNSIDPRVMYVDINSCFATIEQQANPYLRGKPMVVAAYKTVSSTILASSVEAKKLGIKTGMRVKDGKILCPNLIVLDPDPPKYRDVHKKLYNLLLSYSPEVFPKSIDEFVFILPFDRSPTEVAYEIKRKVKENIGDYITVSVGVGPNRYLAKTAAERIKPDGFVEINKNNHLEVFRGMKLTDLVGIKRANEARLKSVGIHTVEDFYNSPMWKLKIAFHGIFGYYWYLRLRGYEIDDFKSPRKTYGNSYAPSQKVAHRKMEIIAKLCEKTGFRLRKAGLGARGVHVGINFRDGGYWHKGVKTETAIFESIEIFKEVKKLLSECTATKTPRVIAINVFNLVDIKNLQLQIFNDVERRSDLTKGIDKVNGRWGDFVIHTARMANMDGIVKDRISFGRL